MRQCQHLKEPGAQHRWEQRPHLSEDFAASCSWGSLMRWAPALVATGFCRV